MSGKQRRVYKCTTCARVFKRSEHCSRHERIHTRERPFSCQYCHKRYARKDLVTRHEKTLHSEKRRQSEVTAIPDSPDSRSSSESSDAVNVSVPSNPSSQPDLMHPPELEKKPRPSRVALPKDFAPVATLAELSPHQVAFTEDRRSSQMVVPVDVMSPPFAFGNAVEALYPSPQSCPEQAHSSLQPWGEPMMAFHEAHMQPTFMPIDPQLCEPHQLLDLGLMSPKHSRKSQATVPSIESRSDSMDATQGSMSPPNKRQKLTTHESRPVDTQRYSHQDLHYELDSTSIDIFRDFWSPPGPAPNRTQDNTITPDSLEFSIPIDPFLEGGQDPSSQENVSLFDSRFSFDDPPPNNGIITRQRSLEKSKTWQEIKSGTPNLHVGPSTYLSICGDLRARTRKGDWDESQLPRPDDLQKFIEGYVNCFHCHFPIIHFPSMRLESAPSPLLLAICCVGALYRLDRRRAAELYELASPLLHSAISSSRKVNPSAPAPSWAVQGSLLLAMYAAFSGRTSHVLPSIERSGFFSAEYRIRRIASMANIEAANPTWEHWVHEESNKRVLCGILVLSNLISVAYGTSPWLSVGEDLQVQLPGKDGLWDAKSSEQWTETKRDIQEGPRQTVEEAMMEALSPDQPQFSSDEDQKPSGFANLVIAHAVTIHVWYVSQLSQSLLGSNTSPAPDSAHALLLSDASSALERFQDALNHGRTNEDYPHMHHPHSPAPAHTCQSSLISNTNALLRIASTRLFFGSTPSFTRFILASSDTNHPAVAVAVDAYLQAPLQRDHPATKGARQAADGFALPARQVGCSPLLVRKTAAFGWSVEHAVAWWDAGLFLGKWVHVLQMNEREGGDVGEKEKKILEDVEACLGEMEVDGEREGDRESGSLAAKVARVGAAFLSDTWVWGVTPKMGSVLLQLADAYERDYLKVVKN